MNYLGYMLGLMTLCILFFACYVLFRDFFRKKRLPSSSSSFTNDNKDPGLVLPYVSHSIIQITSESAEQGYEFEKYVVTKFDKNFFRFLHWNSDKYHQGIHMETTLYPDLVFEYHDKVKTIPFAVECKWWPALIDNAIRWAGSRQIDNYIAYQNKHNMSLYVAIGIGGTPEAPGELFIIPLHKIEKRQLYLTRGFLNQFKKAGADNEFYMETSSMILR
jgi:hypothetical protein